MNETKKALMELKRLMSEATENVFRRIELADAVLSDLDWIATEHGGSDLKAQDAIQAEFFPDLNGYVSLGKLRAMYHNVPRVEWERCRFDIAAIEAVYDGQAEEQAARGPRTAWKEIAEERQETIDAQAAELGKMRDEVGHLRDENARLHGRIEQLEKLLDYETMPV